MGVEFCLSPRYCLDDELPWLEGIDPSRHYWIAVNSDQNMTVAIPGLVLSSLTEMKRFIHRFRSLQPGEQMELVRIASASTIHCISSNCYAIEAHIHHAPVWHLFDRETLDSLLMTAHPDWQCAPTHVDLGRRVLMRSFEKAAAVQS